MISFAHYSSENDISGVSTWLIDFITYCQEHGWETHLHLHHLGDNPARSSIVRSVRETGAIISCGTKPPFTEAGVSDCIDFLNRSQPSLFLPQCLPSFHYAASIAGTVGLPWVFTMHSDDPAYWALAEYISRSGGRPIWVAVSKAIADEASERYPGVDVRVIPCGVAIPKTVAKWQESRFRVVFSGRIVEEQKCISKVVNSLIACCNVAEKIDAVVIGDGPAHQAMVDRVQEHGMAERIRFTGRLDPSRVGDELAKAHAIILMSDYEGLPVALLEAMSYGVVPIVRSIRSGIPELVHHHKTGLLVSDSVSEAADAIARLSVDQQRWKEMSIAARELIEKSFSRETCFAKWIELIDKASVQSKFLFPIVAPSDWRLPRVDPRLYSLDKRKPTFWSNIKTHANRVRRRIVRLRLRK